MVRRYFGCWLDVCVLFGDWLFCPVIMHVFESFNRKPALTAAWLRWNCGRRDHLFCFQSVGPKWLHDVRLWAVSQSVSRRVVLALNNSGKASRFRNSCMGLGSGDWRMLSYFDPPHPWTLFFFPKMFLLLVDYSTSNANVMGLISRKTYIYI